MRYLAVLLLLLTAAVCGAESPLLTIDAPADISDLVPVVEVRGRVADPAGALAWIIAGTDRGGEAPITADGAFSFSVPTDGLHLTQSLRLVVRDSIGHSAERVLLLVDPDPGPVIALDAPADGSPRGPRLALSGRVTGASGGRVEAGLESLAWSLPPTGRGARLEVDEAGRFSSVIDCSGAGDAVLWLRAVDRLGHLTLCTVPLVEPPAAAEATGHSDGGIEIISPAGVVWYRARAIIEGRLIRPEGVDTLSWLVSGDRGSSGEVLVDSDGTFRLELATSELTGDRQLEISAGSGEAGTIRATLEMRDGRHSPAVRIDEPASGGPYGSQLVLAGSVADPYAGIDGVGGIESVSWEMTAPGAPAREEARSGTIVIDPSGSFRVSLPTRGLDGQLVVSVVAVGRSGNTGRSAVRVTRGESDIPSFTAAAGNAMVILLWDPAPEGIRYDVLWAENVEVGDGSGARVIEDVRPPHEVRGLANGSRYVFRLRASRKGEPDGWSSDLDAVPLAPDTLKPTTVGEYDGVSLSWPTVPGVKACEVLRSAASDGEWAVAASGLADGRWFDAHAEAGLTWYYRVRPQAPGAAASDPTPGTALEFAVRALDTAGVLGLEGARSVALAGEYAWVSCGPRGVRVVDLADPDAPLEIAAIELPDARAVAVSGTVACVADGERGIVVLDVAEPRAPRVVGFRYLPDPRAVSLASNVAYVACGAGGVRLLDVSDPRDPLRLDGIDSPDARSLCVSAGRLLVADAVVGLRIFDLGTPKAPTPVADFPMAGARGVSARGGRAIVVGTDGCSLVEVGDAAPSVLAAIPGAAACAVLAADGFAVVAGNGGVSVLDAADPTGRPIDTVPMAGIACLAVEGDMACLVGDGALRLLAVRVQGRSAVVGEAAVDGSAARIAVDGGRALVAARSSGLLVFDVAGDASRSTIRPVAAVSTRFAEDVAAAGPLAFIADGAAGLRIVELASSAEGVWSAQELSSFQPGGVVHGVSVSGSLACIAAGSYGVLMLDVADPAVPRRLAAIPSPDARDVALSGTRLFVADAIAGLRCFDLAVATAPVEAGPALPAAVRVWADGAGALAVSGEGVMAVEWGESGSPRLAGFYRTEWAEDACRDGDRALVAEGHRGLTVLDLADPSRPRVVSAHRGFYAAAVSVRDGVALVGGAGSVKAVKVLVPPWLVR